MDQAGFVLLAAAGDTQREAIIKGLEKAGIPYQLKDLPKSGTPAIGSIVRNRQEIFIPEDHLLTGRKIVEAINSGSLGTNGESPWLKSIIIILVNLVIFLAVAYFIYTRYLN